MQTAGQRAGQLDGFFHHAHPLVARVREDVSATVVFRILKHDQIAADLQAFSNRYQSSPLLFFRHVLKYCDTIHNVKAFVRKRQLVYGRAYEVVTWHAARKPIDCVR